MLFFFYCRFSAFSLSPAPRLIFFGLPCSCQLLLGTMAASLSQPSARSGRTLFGLPDRGGCFSPRLCTRCWLGRHSWGSRSARRRSVAGIRRCSWTGRSIPGILDVGYSWSVRCARCRRDSHRRTKPKRCWRSCRLGLARSRCAPGDPRACISADFR